MTVSPAAQRKKRMRSNPHSVPVHRTVTYRMFESPLTSKKPDTHKGIRFFGDPSGIRTPDPLLKRQLLYRLS